MMRAVFLLCLTVGICHGAELDRFFKISKSVIQDPTDSMRIRRIDNVTPEDCAKLCWEESRCKTVEYKEEHQKCDLSTADYQSTEHSIITSAYGWETYALYPDARSLAELEVSAAEKLAEITSVQESSTAAQSNSTELEQFLEDANSELDSMQTSMAELAESKAQYQQQHESLAAEVTQQQSVLEEAMAGNAQVQNQIKENEESLDGSREFVGALEESITEKDSLIEQAVSERNQLKSNLATVTSSRSGKQEEINNLNKQIKQLKADIVEADEPEITKARDCAELYKKYDIRDSGVYNIYPIGPKMNSVRVYCDMGNGGGWTVIQKRDTTQSCKYNFNKLWAEYKSGFGRAESDHYLGNDIISRLTSTPTTLRVEVKDSRRIVRASTYSAFQMGSESLGYSLKQITFQSGDAGNQLTILKNARFGTTDHENNSATCSRTTQGGFWFKTNRYCARKMFSWCLSYRTACSTVNLNAGTARWSSSTTYSAMKIRPSNF